MPGKFSRSATIAVSAPIQTIAPDLVTHEGGIGWSRDPKSELFLLAVSNMVGEDTFYESGKDRDQRFRELIRRVAIEDAVWVARFVPFLRDTMHLRSASVVMAAELVKVKLETGQYGNRAIIDSALMRADEPAEMLGYWLSHYGRKLPMPVKRGIADATLRLYNERSALKYDGQSGAIRMGDVIDLTHPKPKAEWQTHLFRYLLDRRHNRDWPEEGYPLAMITAAHELESVEDRRAVLSDPDRLTVAGFTWERLSGWLKGPMDATAWQAVIPSMGYMALLRNLRNFDDAGIPESAKGGIIAKLADPVEVAKSRQLPLRFYSAWKAARSLSWGGALEAALNKSVENVPRLKGRSLILVDTSGSMNSPQSERSKALRWELAALFGATLALRSEAFDLVSFQTDTRTYHPHPSDSVLRTVDAIGAHVGGGTNTHDAIVQHFNGQDRIVILTDEQAFYSPLALNGMPTVPTYTFNLAGYKAGHLPSGSDQHYTFGGLTDAGFTAIELLESGRDAIWPF